MGVFARGNRALADGSVVEWLFTDRTGGVSSPPFDTANLALHVGDDPGDVARNRAALAAELSIDVDSLATMTQVHGRDVAFVAGPHAIDPPPQADALVTDVADVALVTQVADCVPILLASPQGTIAAVHSGWRGVVAGVTTAAIEALFARGVEPESIRAWIGPSICPSCYEVGADVRDQVAAAAESAFATTAAGAPAVDVRAGVVEQLAHHGITAEVIDACTAEDDALYSYRRDGRTGRQAGVIIRRLAPGRPE